MTSEKSVIQDSIRQVKKIYEQVSVLIKTADDLMGEHGWEPEKPAVIFGSSAAVYAPRQWLPSVLTRKYRHKESINTVLSMGVLLDDVLDDMRIEEPLIIATRLSVKDTSEDFPYTNDNDDPYWWFMKSANLEAVGEVVEIDKPQDVYEKETRSLGRVLTFAVPLLEIESSDELRDKFVVKLLALSE